MIKEECGLTGVFKNENAAEIIYTCLFSLQHRGQESSGIIVSSDSSVNIHRAVELVSDVFTQDVIKPHPYWWNKEGKYTVVVIDCGTKYNILRLLAERNLRVRVVPADFPLEENIKKNPDGIILSNGPGDLEFLNGLVRTVQNLVERYPVFGICLGQQILGQAFGGKTFKLKFGHHSANHPVKDLTTGKIHITVQNQGFCVDIESLKDPHLEITHINLNDHTLEGMHHKKYPVFSVQFHPEASLGPYDAIYLFDYFYQLIVKMPKRTDINSIMIIGSGPIVIWQACEFDYSGSQACKAIKEEGYRVILVNSNTATIMTDPEMSHSTYIEPLVFEVLEKIIKIERPDALLPTIGGQTGFNLDVELCEKGVLKKYGVRLIGANYDAIHKAEDRQLFKQTIINIGLSVPRSEITYCLEDGMKIGKELGFPIILRPGFTLGGTGSAIVYNMEELKDSLIKVLDLSLNKEVLLEESVLGWKEFELEAMRGIKYNVVIICSIENFDPMGIHTGDSITVAPAPKPLQTKNTRR